MRRRPWILIVLAFLHIIAPIGNIVLNAVISNDNIIEHFKTVTEAGYLARNWPMFLAPIIAGIAIYACKRWSILVFFASMMALFYFSYQGYLSKAQSIGLGPVLFIYMINILVVGYFLLPAVREIYMNPRLRWWESKPRYHCDFPCRFNINGKDEEGIVGNFSLGGLFLKTDCPLEDHSTIKLSFENHENKTINFKGKTVHHGKQNTVGFGLMFIHGRQSIADARILIQHLEKSGRRMGSREKFREDSFFHWIKTLVSTGHGIIPTKDQSRRS